MARVRTHPGLIIKHEFLEPLGLSATALAKELGIPANRMTEIVATRRAVTADTAMRLSRHFGTTPEMWLNLQTASDLSVAAIRNDYSKIRRRAA